LLEEKEWFQTGVANLNTDMVGEKSTRDLANGILSNLCVFTNSSTGALYLLKEDGRLHLAGTYAVDLENIKTILHRKEGIPGQCLESGQHILRANTPDTESTIVYGAGKTKPRNLVSIPIPCYKRHIGVMEFASF